MATPTYTLIDSEVLGSSAASVTFTSLNTLAAGYRDVVLIVESIGTVASDYDIRARVNSDTGSNYSMVRMSGDGSSATSGATTVDYFNLTMGPVYLRDTERVLVKAEFLDFSATDKHKTLLVRSNSALSGVSAIAQRWANTSAITSLEVFTSANDFASGATFYLYGIA